MLLLDLPPDVLRRVGRFLVPEDLRCLRLGCRALRDVGGAAVVDLRPTDLRSLDPASFPSLERLHLDPMEGCAPRDLWKLTRLSSLTHLQLGRRLLPDKRGARAANRRRAHALTVADLSLLRTLRSLDVARLRLSDAMVMHLALGLPRLEELFISDNSALSDQGLAKVRGVRVRRGRGRGGGGHQCTVCRRGRGLWAVSYM